MEEIELYYAVEELRNYIYRFNFEYKRNDFEVDIKVLASYVQKVCDMKENEILRRMDKTVDVQTLQDSLQFIHKAVHAEDYVSIYDILNGELRTCVFIIGKTLYHNCAEKFCEYFWQKNREALKIRYPEMLALLERADNEDKSIGIRSYGQRGRVVYRRNEDREYDLYSAYIPFETEDYMTEIYGGFEECSRIFMWGCNGGFEIDAILHKSNSEKQRIKVFVTDLTEFKYIMKNMQRSGDLLRPEITWNFCADLKELFRDVELEKREEVYIYVSRYYYGDIKTLKRFIVEHSLKNNLGLDR